MARSPYLWKTHGAATPIKQHSVAKHEVLQAYLLEYLQTLVGSPHQEELKVTLVDGFSGGGIYQHEDTRQLVLGSPFVFLRTVKEAEALINTGRQKPIRMNVDYFFVEKNRDNFALLQKTLSEQGYAFRIGADVKLIRGCFEGECRAIRDFIKQKSPRAGRSIFLLDQYGYKDVPLPLVRSILSELPAAEVILTFAVDAFITYANDSKQTVSSLNQIGIPDVLRGRTIDDIKKHEKDFRLYIQSCLYRNLVEACGARYYTLFFIRTDGHGVYWLVHMSQHPRARDVMTRIHWLKNNNVIHYGGAGINMFQALGYSAAKDETFTGQSDLAFCFDNPAADASIGTLMHQLPHIVYAREEGISFGELFATTCNSSPADSLKYKEALARLVELKEVEIASPSGGRRRSASTITDKDQLLPARQGTLFMGNSI